MSDGNTYAINKHLDEIDEAIAREEAKWLVCDECGEYTEYDRMNDNDMCDDCNAPDPRQMDLMFTLYEAEKRAGLLKTPEELDQELRDAGRGHLARGGL